MPTAYRQPVIAAGDLVNETEAAQILGVAIQTLRNWRWKGTGPRVRRVGQRLVRYDRRDLAAFVNGEDAGAEKELDERRRMTKR